MQGVTERCEAQEGHTAAASTALQGQLDQLTAQHAAAVQRQAVELDALRITVEEGLRAQAAALQQAQEGLGSSSASVQRCEAGAARQAAAVEVLSARLAAAEQQLAQSQQAQGAAAQEAAATAAQLRELGAQVEALAGKEEAEGPAQALAALQKGLQDVQLGLQLCVGSAAHLKQGLEGRVGRLEAAVAGGRDGGFCHGWRASAGYQCAQDKRHAA